MRNSDILQKKFDRAMKTGEVPYQANRRALKVLDILNDGEGGLQDMDIMRRGLKMLIDDLNTLGAVSRKLQGLTKVRFMKAGARSGMSVGLPAYGKMRSVTEFGKIAIHFAKMRKAIVEIRRLEDFFLAGNVAKEDFKSGLADIVYFSGTVADEVTKSVAKLKVMSKKVSVYERELLNAVS
jgi:hypothetical protein